MSGKKAIFFELILLLIITIPAFLSIWNNQYFSMHDDQHIVRLYLLDQGIKQGNLYPRWVDGLGFGFGYPLYNFYPPLVYFIGEIFHLLGFSLIWSVKLTFILGFYLAALGIFLLVKRLLNRVAGFVAATLYTYFFYHAVLIYVRGALAEFFSLAVLPFVFLAFHNLFKKLTIKNAIAFGMVWALLILTHPLIAFPASIFLGFFFLFYLFILRFNLKFVYLFICSFLLGLSLSAFFWLPSFFERKYTLTDQILTTELASYKLHYIYPQQFIYSLWGYGGSGQGLADGMTFQLGKMQIGLVVGAVFMSFIYLLVIQRHSGKRPSVSEGAHPESFYKADSGQARMTVRFFYFFIFLLLFSLFMTTSYSSFIWDKVKYLWYLQFPWRFLTFAALFISITGGYPVFFLDRLIGQNFQPQRLENRLWRPVYYFCIFIIILGTIFIYQKYFKPQYYISTSDKERTSFEEVVWRISGTSYEFVPKGVKTKKTDLGTTTLAIEEADLPKKPYEIISGQAEVEVVKNNFAEKTFVVNAITPVKFRLNNYNFPGWKGYINVAEAVINDDNSLKLITINIPSGKHEVRFIFSDTPVRKLGNFISVVSLICVIAALCFILCRGSFSNRTLSTLDL